jgi:hypothetical protein
MKFRYQIRDADGEKIDIDVKMYVIGDAHLSDNVGEVDGVDAGISDIWEALSVNTIGDVHTAPNIGDNNLEIRMTNKHYDAGHDHSGLLTNPIDLVYIPIPRMDWAAPTTSN